MPATNRKMKLNSGYTPYTNVSPTVAWTRTYRKDVQVSTATNGATYTVTITLIGTGASASTTITATSGTAYVIAGQIVSAINLPVGWRGSVQQQALVGSFIITSPDDFTVTVGTRLTAYTRNFWLGDIGYENRMLNYVSSLNVDWVQLYGLYSILNPATDYQTLEIYLARFIEKCKVTYNFKRVGAILGDLGGFQRGFAFNSIQPSSTTKFNDWNLENEFWFGYRVDFSFSTVVVGTTYQITITHNAVTYTFTYAATTTSPTDVAQQLYNRMVGIIPGFVVQLNGSVITVFNRSNLNAFTYTISPSVGTAKMSAAVINISFSEWVSLATYIKLNADPLNDARTCYIANPLSSWTSADAQQFCGLFSEIEMTNYTTSPNERHPSFRDKMAILIANAAAVVGTTEKFSPLHSAEPAFCRNYFLSNTIISPPTGASENYWANLWNTDTFSNKARLNWQGFTYFVFKEFYTAPSILV